MIGISFLFILVESHISTQSTNFLSDCTRTSSAMFTYISIDPYPFEDGRTKFSFSFGIFTTGTYILQFQYEMMGFL